MEKSTRDNREKWSIGLFFLILTFAFGLFQCEVHAANDTTAPLITKVNVDTTSVKGLYGEVTLSLSVMEEETGVALIEATFYHKEGCTTHHITVTNTFETGKTTGNLTCTSFTMADMIGEYYLGTIKIEDHVGNSRTYNNGTGFEPSYDSYDDLWLKDSQGYYLQDNSIPEERCYSNENRMVNILSADGSSLPKATTLNIKNSSVNKGGMLSFEIMLEKEEKVSQIQLNLYNETQGCDQYLLLHMREESTINDNGTYYINGQKIVCSVTIPYDMPSGSYSVFTLQLENKNGGKVYWSKDNPNYISDGINNCYLTGTTKLRVNSDGDDEAPHITNIKIVNNLVKKPGVMKIQITARDNKAIKSIFIFTKEEKQEVYGYSVEKTYSNPEASWTKTFSIPISTSVTNGKYMITLIRIKDASGNTRDYQNWNEYNEGRINNVLNDEKGYYLSCYLGNQEEKAYFTGSPFITVEDEFDVAFNVGLSNSKLMSYINNMEDSQAGKIRIEGSKKVDASVFRAIQGKDKTLIFYNSNYQWIFHGKDIMTPKTINLNIGFRSEDGAEYGTTGKVLQISFADNGTLPGRANIRIKSDYTRIIYKLTNNLYLYYCNNSNEQLELEDKSNINYYLDDSDSWCSFYITHNSDFIASGKRLTNTAIPKKKGTKITVKGNQYKVLGKCQVEFVKPGNKGVKKIVIPNTIKYKKVTYKVTRIAAKACNGCKKLKSVSIGNSIEKIGTKAFYNAKQLTNIDIKTKLLTSKNVGNKAFKGVPSKVKIKVPKKVLNKYKKILKAKGISQKAKIKY